MLDLSRWQPVSTRPPIRRDLSIVTTGPPDAELLGGAVRSALGAAAEDLESVSILNSTPWQHLSPAARARLGLRPDQQNVVLRLVLRPLDRSLTAEQANQLRDEVYATIHEGPTCEWAARTGL
jgi:phenylalanyl-tRNA synthetase alpha chain